MKKSKAIEAITADKALSILKKSIAKRTEMYESYGEQMGAKVGILDAYLTILIINDPAYVLEQLNFIERRYDITEYENELDQVGKLHGSYIIKSGAETILELLERSNPDKKYVLTPKIYEL
jgi:hypothetical protein